MGEKGKKWWHLESPAKLFPATSHAKDERVFRVSCVLHEKIDGKKLQFALDQCMENYPVFLCVMRGGLFWNYMEETDIRPIVREEYQPPCSQIYVHDQKNLLFEVTYYEKRINFETYHALTDGNGALQFLRSLVYYYLMAVHPETVSGPVSQVLSDAGIEEMEEDSFQKYLESFHEPVIKDIPTYNAHQLKYHRLEFGGVRLEEGIVSVKEVQSAARKYHTTVTVYLAAVFLCSLAKDMTESQKKRPVSLMVPVNLRNYFPSSTMKNFFWWIDLGYNFSKQSNRLEDVIIYTADFFKRELTKERIAARMQWLMSVENHPLIRMIPLRIKAWGMQIGDKWQTSAHTALLSNLGRITMPKECEAYIDQFDFFTCTPKVEICICSWQDKLSLGLTSAFADRCVENNFYNMLKEEAINAEMITWNMQTAELEEPNHFPSLKTEIKKLHVGFRMFTYFCLVVAVLSLSANLLTGIHTFWARYVLAGALCTWGLSAMAIRKRRNLLKTAVWEMWLFWLTFMLWDAITGWHGWALNYAVPIVWLLTLGLVLCTIFFQKLEETYYMVYLMLIVLSCLVPLLLLVSGIVRDTLPCMLASVCGVGMALVMILFKGKTLTNEFRKKMHM